MYIKCVTICENCANIHVASLYYLICSSTRVHQICIFLHKCVFLLNTSFFILTIYGNECALS